MRHRFEEMTRRDALEKVLAGMRAAEAAGLTPIKINCVVIGGTNDDEVVDFARDVPMRFPAGGDTGELRDVEGGLA